MADERDKRALRRAAWPGGLVATQTPAQLSTAAERVASMWQLALDAWSSSGRPVPDYRREDAPGRLIRSD